MTDPTNHLCNRTGLGSEPDLQLRTTHGAVYIVAVVLGSTSLLFSIVCLIFNCVARNNRVVKMSSPRLNMMISCGGILGSIACMMMGADSFLGVASTAGHSICQARVSLLAVSSTLMLAPMVGKTWRVNRIFRFAGSRRVVIKDVRLAAFTLTLVCIDIIWALLWNFVDPLKFNYILLWHQRNTYKTLDNLNLSGLFTSNDRPESVDIFDQESPSVVTVVGCSSQWSDVWLAGLMFLKMPGFVWGLREAWWTRGHVLPTINDAPCLTYSTLTAGGMTLTYILTTDTLKQSPSLADVCVVGYIWISLMVALSSVFIPKFLLWRSTPKGQRARVSISSVSNSLTFVQSFENLEGELSQAHAEIDELKDFIKQKETDMEKLQLLLTNAENSLAHIQISHPDLDIPGHISDSYHQSRGNPGRDSIGSGNEDDNDIDDDEDGALAEWSGAEGGASGTGVPSSGDEGAVVTDEFNSSVEAADKTGQCCLHGAGCRERDNDKDGCWYLPSDRGYAPAHTLRPNRRRANSHRHQHHRNHHVRQPRSRPGRTRHISLSTSSSVQETNRTTTSGRTYGGGVSSCSSSVFTDANKGKDVHHPHCENSYYTKKTGLLPTRRHSHGSVYAQHQQRIHNGDQHQEQLMSRQLFEYPLLPGERHPGLAFLPDWSQAINYPRNRWSESGVYDVAPTKAHHYSSSSSHGKKHVTSQGQARLRLPKSQTRKRRRSSTPSVQSAGSQGKLSKLRSDLSNAMEISKRLATSWPSEINPERNDKDIENTDTGRFRGKSSRGLYEQKTSGSSGKRGLFRGDNPRRQTVIGLQGIADSIIESYSFARTQDNHSFVHDCITPRSFDLERSSASTMSRETKSGTDCHDKAYPFTYSNNCYNGSTHISNSCNNNSYKAAGSNSGDFHTIDAGDYPVSVELFGLNKMNNNNNPSEKLHNTQHMNRNNKSEENTKHNCLNEQHPNYDSGYNNLRSSPYNRASLEANNSRLYDPRSLPSVNSKERAKVTFSTSNDPGPNECNDAIVFLPPITVSLQSLVNQASWSNGEPATSDRDAFHVQSVGDHQDGQLLTHTIDRHHPTVHFNTRFPQRQHQQLPPYESEVVHTTNQRSEPPGYSDPQTISSTGLPSVSAGLTAAHLDLVPRYRTELPHQDGMRRSDSFA